MSGTVLGNSLVAKNLVNSYNNVSKIVSSVLTDGFDSEVVKQVTSQLSSGTREFLSKEFAFVMGTFAYISFLVMAFHVYWPNYAATMNVLGTSGRAIVAFSHIAMAGILFFYLFGEFVPRELSFLANKTWLERMFIITVFFMVLIHLRAMSLTSTSYFIKHPDKKFEWNRQVTKFVDSGRTVYNLAKAYEKLRRNNKGILLKRANTALCASMYDARLRISAKAKNDQVDDENENKDDEEQNTFKAVDFSPNCTFLDAAGALRTTRPKCLSDTDPLKGAPVLSEFYIMTSNRTCVVQNQIDAYVSPKMIEIALDAGARCLDFDIYPDSFVKNPIPIVTLALDSNNRNLMHNFVPLKTCLETIANHWFRRARTEMEIRPGTTKRNAENETDDNDTNNYDDNYLIDPLFLHLNIHTTVNKSCCDQVAMLLRYYFDEYVSGRLLDSSYNYRIRNMGTVPICKLFGKVVIMVRAVERPALIDSKDPALNRSAGATISEETKTISKQCRKMVHNAVVSDALLELANCVSGVSNVSNVSGNVKNTFYDVEYKDLLSTADANTIRNRNRRHLTFIRSSAYPYSDLSIEVAAGVSTYCKEISEDAFVGSKTSVPSDHYDWLLLRKSSFNLDPGAGFRLGAQFVAMNFHALDANQSRNVGFFRNSSLVLKPLSLRRKEVQYTEPIEGRYGVSEAVPCDTSDDVDLSDEREKLAQCAAKNAERTTQAKQEDLQKTSDDIDQRSNKIKERPVFYGPESE